MLSTSIKERLRSRRDVFFRMLVGMTQIQDTVKGLITEALSSAGYPPCDFVLEHPSDMSHGDYATNVALVLSKSVGESSRAVADKITAYFQRHDAILGVSVAGPGFINITLSRNFLRDSVARAVTQNERWGENTLYKNERIIVEHTDPNPFKELHIGHLVPNALGESIAYLMEASGAEVRRVTFQGDVGMHVAKAMYGLQVLGFTKDSKLTAQDLGKAYAKGATLFEESEDDAQKIKVLNKAIYERSDGEVNALYDLGKKISLEYFEEAYRVIGTTFEHLFFESVTGPVGAEIVRTHIGDVFEESDGAVIYRGEKVGLHTRVFINAEGLPTYEAKDIGLMKCKYDWWPFTRSITVAGAEIRDYFKVISAAAGDVLPELAGHVEFVPNGMLRLSEGKMSSRTGNVIPALDLIGTVKEKILAVMSDTDIENRESVATDVAVGAIKFAILRSGAGKDIIFDFEKSISFEGDSGPYLQYTHARIASVVEKAHNAGIRESADASPLQPYILERMLYRFPEVVLHATTEREPHHVVTYLIELASEFNAFYANERIADVSDTNAPYKLMLANAVKLTLKNGLRTLGIKAPERM